MMAQGQDGMYLMGEFDRESGESSLRLEAAINRTDRRYKVNGKEESNLITYLSQVNVVIFFPESLRMVKEGPALRRVFFDRAIAGEDPKFLTEFREYNRLVSERNRLLKQGNNSDMMDVWEQMLVKSAARIVVHRCLFLNSLQIFLNSVKQQMGISRNIEIFYRSGGTGWSGENWPDLLKDSKYLEDAAESILKEGASRVRDDEMRRGVTLWGPHLDDFDFFLDNQRVRDTASQGEQRLFVVLLVMAAAQSYRESQNEEPIVLLDDFSSELDDERIDSVLGFLETMGSQVFITSTQRPRRQGCLEFSKFFSVKNGIITA
jgi:DNA replication and repair protein RecF